MDIGGLLAGAGFLGLSLGLWVLARLSRRFGAVTRAPRYYVGLYAAALVVALSGLGRMTLATLAPVQALRGDDPLLTLLLVGLPAIGVSLAAIIGWRYWSWLLAERG